ncbi:MAG: hypothetical protein A2Y78_08845 [Acidobacteria bacterium RBG_13_68_16]|nr:MAG: hypothetical protein A2Y78_08845 [Acidobacteria bacterium RBG_13_68_16]
MRRAFPTCLILVIVVQAWVFLMVPTDNNGDPNDYLVIAQGLFSRMTPFTLNRSIGYPLFIKVASLDLHNLNLLFLVQSVLFVVAIFYFASSLSLPPILRCLVCVPALIPGIAYMQKLLFPDGLILSLLLLFMIQLVRRKVYYAAAIGLILTAIKIFFIFLLPLVLAAWAVENWHISVRKAYVSFCIFLLLLVPLVFAIRPFPLYQTIVQIPDFVSGQINPVGPLKELRVSCGGAAKTITDPTVLASILKHSADEYYIPLGSTVTAQLGCTQGDVRRLQRQLILYYLSRAPLFQAKKILMNVCRAAFVFPQNEHVGYMLRQKADLATRFYDDRFFYEDRQVQYFRDVGLAPLKQPGLVLLRLTAHNNLLIRALSLGILGFVPLIAWKLLKKRDVLRLAFPVVVFIAAYSVLLSWFAFIYDRYVYVNYFLWMYLIALWANETFPGLARASLAWPRPLGATSKSE